MPRQARSIATVKPNRAAAGDQNAASKMPHGRCLLLLKAVCPVRVIAGRGGQPTHRQPVIGHSTFDAAASSGQIVT